jgi:hypothetical protein
MSGLSDATAKIVTSGVAVTSSWAKTASKTAGGVAQVASKEVVIDAGTKVAKGAARGAAMESVAVAGAVAGAVQLADTAAGSIGVGQWSCCGAVTRSAGGCAFRWSCCKMWQTASAKADVACERLVCMGCLGDPNHPPPNESQELKCEGYNAYVGVVPASFSYPPRRPCIVLEGDEKHDIASSGSCNVGQMGVSDEQDVARAGCIAAIEQWPYTAASSIQHAKEITIKPPLLALSLPGHDTFVRVCFGNSVTRNS